MTSVAVGLGSRSYEIAIEAGALANADRHLAPHARNGRLTVVTDANVAKAHLETLTAAMARAGIRIGPIVLPPGEATKSWAALEQLCDTLLSSEIERSEAIVALGGGVIGDLAGFAAAVLKRGCGVIQIPTTLLAQVDSSVGGKTAINARAGKNLIGAFHQPLLVLIDPLTLDTLPVRQLRAGYAEVVKYGLIDNPAFFTWCEANGAALLDGDQPARAYAIEHSVRAKAAIVADDERETSGRRAQLNLGHTFGHALEAETGFGDALLHGEAVAAGICMAFRYSVTRGLCPPDDAVRVGRHLASAGLPTGARTAGVGASGAALARHMAHDKKRTGGSIPFLLARSIGQVFLDTGISLNDVAVFLDSDNG